MKESRSFREGDEKVTHLEITLLFLKSNPTAGQQLIVSVAATSHKRDEIFTEDVNMCDLLY